MESRSDVCSMGKEINEILPDSTEYGSDIDLFDGITQPLGVLPPVSTSTDKPEDNTDFDSDETMLSDVSVELPFIQTPKCRSSLGSNLGISTQMTRRKLKRHFRSFYSSSQPERSKASVCIAQKPTEKHCQLMESLNIVEAKLSSISHLVSLDNLQYIEQAKTMLNEDARKRLNEIELSLDKCSLDDGSGDSEGDDEEKQLREVRSKRYQSVFDQFKTISKTVDEGSQKISQVDMNIDASQSILASVKTRQKTSNFNKRFPVQKLKCSSKLVYVMDKLPTTPITANKKTTQVNKDQIHIPMKIISKPHISLTQSTTKTSREFGSEPDEYNMDYDEDISNDLPTDIANSSASNTKPFVSSLNVGCSGSVVAKPACIPQKQNGLAKFRSNNYVIYWSKQSTNKLSSVKLSSNDSCFKDLVQRGLVSKGPSVLKLYSQGREYVASVSSCGLIVSSDYEVYSTPQLWVQAVTNQLWTKQVAYKKVFYIGESLDEIEKRLTKSYVIPQTPTFPQNKTQPKSNKIGPTLDRSTVTSSDDFCHYFRNCKFLLPADEDLFITRNLLGSDSDSEFSMLANMIDN